MAVLRFSSAVRAAKVSLFETRFLQKSLRRPSNEVKRHTAAEVARATKKKAAPERRPYLVQLTAC